MALGKQIILELYECDAQLLSNPELVEKEMRRAAEAMGATIVTSAFHHFSPLGVSGVVVIQESHLTVHTWPEHAYAAVDIFTCGDIDMSKGTAYLQQAFSARRKEEQTLARGNLNFTNRAGNFASREK